VKRREREGGRCREREGDGGGGRERKGSRKRKSTRKRANEREREGGTEGALRNQYSFHNMSPPPLSLHLIHQT